MLKRKPLMIAAIAAATLGATALSSQAYANDDALLGAVVGAGIGAAIGHNVQGRDGAVVGSAIGAIAGASIAASSSDYYDTGYYAAPAYYPAVPVYYARPQIYYAPRADYVHYYGPRHVDYRASHDRWQRDWHGDDGHHGR